MNNNLNEKILSSEIKNLILKINSEFPDVVFGGSIVLNAVGLIERKIGDIDIFVPKKHRILNSKYVLDYLERKKNIFDGEVKTVHDYFSSQCKVEEMKQNEDVFSENGLFTLRTGIVVDNIKVCIFEVQNEDELKYFNIKIDEMNEIKVQNIQYAIKTKCLYIEKAFTPNLDKHISDMFEIYKPLSNIKDKFKKFENKSNIKDKFKKFENKSNILDNLPF